MQYSYLREKYAQDVAKQQYLEISQQAIKSEKRASEILEKVLDSPKDFFLIHSIIDFDKVSKKFYDSLTTIVAKIKYHSDIQITNHILLFQYRKMILQLLAKRKLIFNDIVLNAIPFKFDESTDLSSLIGSSQTEE